MICKEYMFARTCSLLCRKLVLGSISLQNSVSLPLSLNNLAAKPDLRSIWESLRPTLPSFATMATEIVLPETWNENLKDETGESMSKK